jgi:hypothetical protein
MGNIEFIGLYKKVHYFLFLSGIPLLESGVLKMNVIVISKDNFKNKWFMVESGEEINMIYGAV